LKGEEKDQSLLNAIKLIGRNKGTKKLIEYVHKNGIATLGDIGRVVKNHRVVKRVERDMKLCHEEEGDE